MTATKPALALLTILLLAACGGDDEGDDSPTAPDDISGFDPNVAPVASGTWYRPGTATTWQWQLQETLNTSYDVDLYEVDLFDTPAATIQSLKDAGRAVLCISRPGRGRTSERTQARSPQSFAATSTAASRTNAGSTSAQMRS